LRKYIAAQQFYVREFHTESSLTPNSTDVLESLIVPALKSAQECHCWLDDRAASAMQAKP